MDQKIITQLNRECDELAASLKWLESRNERRGAGKGLFRVKKNGYLYE